jgi:hypothetical protein
VADVNVTFGAVDEGLTSSIRKYEAELAAVPQALVGQSGTQYEVINGKLEVLRGTVNKVTGATNELSDAEEKVTRSGINVIGMLERMAVRFAIFETFRLALGAIVKEIEEFKNIGQAQRQLDALSDSLAHAARNQTLLAQSAQEANIGIPQGEKMVEILTSYGMSLDAATVKVESLGKASALLTTNEKDREMVTRQLAEAYGRLYAGETLTEAQERLLARASGDLRERNLALVNTYEELRRAGPAAIKAIDENLKALEEDTRSSEQALDRHLSAIEKIGRGMDRAAQETYQAQLKQYQQDLAKSPLRAANMLAMGYGALSAPTPPTPPPAGGELGRELQAGGGPLVSAGMLAQYQKGLEQLAKDAGQTVQEVQAEVKAGWFDVRDVMGAAKEKEADELRAAQDAAQKEKESIRQQEAAAKEARDKGLREGLAPGAPGIEQPFAAQPSAQVQAIQDFFRGWETRNAETLAKVIPTDDLSNGAKAQERTATLLENTFGGT